MDDTCRQYVRSDSCYIISVIILTRDTENMKKKKNLLMNQTDSQICYAFISLENFFKSFLMDTKSSWIDKRSRRDIFVQTFIFSRPWKRKTI